MRLRAALTSAEYRVTRMASTGGFLRSGVATLLLGVDDLQVDSAIKLIRETIAMGAPTEKRVSLFVVPVERLTNPMVWCRLSSPTNLFQHKIINQPCLPKKYRHRKQSLSGYFLQLL